MGFEFGVWGLGFGVWGLGFGVWGLGFGVWGLGFGVWGLGFGVWGLGFQWPLSVYALTASPPDVDAYPQTLFVIAGHGLVFAWYYAMFNALEVDSCGGVGSRH